MAESMHDRKTRLNLGVPRSLVPRLEAVRGEHPGIWKSNGELALEAIRVGLKAHRTGARLPEAPTRKDPGAGYLTVSLPFELASCSDAELAARGDAARSRRDLLLAAMQLGLDVIEGAGTPSGAVASRPADGDWPVPAELVQRIREILADRPLLVADRGYEDPEDFVDSAIRSILPADAQASADAHLAELAEAALPSAPLVRSGGRGSLVVTREAVQAVRSFLDGDPVLARTMGCATPAAYLAATVEAALASEADVAADLEHDAAHPAEARARESWWRRVAEAKARGDRARLVELGDEQTRALAAGRFPWQACGPTAVPATAPPEAKYAPGT